MFNPLLIFKTELVQGRPSDAKLKIFTDKNCYFSDLFTLILVYFREQTTSIDLDASKNDEEAQWSEKI